MNNQRLRNLTTGRLHTDIGHVYTDLEWLMGETGLMTHMLPGALDACEPWLRKHVTDLRFWNGEFDPMHTGDLDLPTPTAEERADMLRRYRDGPDPLKRNEGPVQIPREALERIALYLMERHASTDDPQERRRVKALIVAVQEVLDPDTNRSKPNG